MENNSRWLRIKYMEEEETQIKGKMDVNDLNINL